MPDIETLKKELDKTIEHLRHELSQIRTGRATAELVDGVKVKAYDTESPITSLASVTVEDIRTLAIEPWDKSIVENIASAVSNAGMGFGVRIDGHVVRATVPELTTERRMEYVKVMKDRVEEARKAIRGHRRTFMKQVDDQIKDGGSEEEGKRLKERAEKIVKDVDNEIAQMRKTKEESLMEM